MSKYSALVKRASNATAALALTLASLTPAVMLGGSAKAGQMTERSIMMSNSKLSASSSYTVSFKPTLTTTIKRIVVDFCEGSPIIGADCTNEMEDMVVPTTGTISVLLNGAAGTNFTVSGTDGTTDEVILSSATGRTITTAASDVVSFVIPGITNESANAGSFYARLVTYDADNTAYADNSVGAYIDAGGVALSTTEDITINARVQEQLTFCAGATVLYTGISNCSTGWNGQTIDLGVLTSGSTATTPVSTATDGNTYEGAFFVTTNAYYGVKVYYSSPNSLKAGVVSEANCEAGTTTSTDQCINSVGTAAAFPAVGTERFGMSVTNFNDNDNPDGEGTISASNSYGGSYAWNTTSQVEIASTTGVISQEVAQLTFKANAAATTPSGYYSTSANFVAVGSF